MLRTILLAACTSVLAAGFAASTASAFEIVWAADLITQEPSTEVEIFQTDAAGTPVGPAIGDVDTPVGIDVGGGRIYWADPTRGTVERVERDGTDREVIHSVDPLAPGATLPRDLALDAAAGKVYWTQNSASSASIFRSDLDGSALQEIVVPASGSVGGIALDRDGGKIYWTESASVVATGIHRANLDGSAAELLFVAPPEGIGPAGPIDVDPLSGRVYWAQGTNLKQADLDGSNQSFFLGDPFDNCFFDCSVYQALTLTPGGGSLYDNFYEANRPNGVGFIIERSIPDASFLSSPLPDFANYVGGIAVVPEPGTLVLLAVGLGLLGTRSARRS